MNIEVERAAPTIVTSVSPLPEDEHDPTMRVTWIDGVFDVIGSPHVLDSSILFAAPTCRFRFLPLAAAPNSPLVRPLADRVGPRQALDLLLSGGELTADEALALHLIDGVLDQAAFREWTSRLESLSPQSQRLATEITALQTAASDAAAEVAERYGFALAFALPDSEEGIRAFLEKRPPEFNRT